MWAFNYYICATLLSLSFLSYSSCRGSSDHHKPVRLSHDQSWWDHSQERQWCGRVHCNWCKQNFTTFQVIYIKSLFHICDVSSATWQETRDRFWLADSHWYSGLYCWGENRHLQADRSCDASWEHEVQAEAEGGAGWAWWKWGCDFNLNSAVEIFIYGKNMEGNILFLIID